jgi:UDP-galactopyranose mutase
MLDYLIVGAGMFGSTFARLATDAGKKCLVIDSREHIAGNCYSEELNKIHVHTYGPHIFHTNDDEIWSFVNRFASFNNYTHSPLVKSHSKIYSLPFTMHTFNQLWGVTTVEEAKATIESQCIPNNDPQNLEEHALATVGTDIYNLLIKDYTRKQWQRDPKDLPASIIKRIPIRFNWDTRTFTDKYQGVPHDGYTKMFERILDGVEVRLGINFFKAKDDLSNIATKIVYTGKIDEFYDYRFGKLEYRTLRFEHETLDIPNYQDNAQVNCADNSGKHTRTIEHKHFNPEIVTNNTIITREIPDTWSDNKIPMYPINDSVNTALLNRYMELADMEENIIFGGRLAEYKYYDMHQVIGAAMKKFRIDNEL